jgi:FAD/FMN-containing dehydrogenase
VVASSIRGELPDVSGVPRRRVRRHDGGRVELGALARSLSLGARRDRSPRRRDDADGCSIYFSFAGHAPDAQAASRLYDSIWRDGLEATTRVGGTISHHHGVGLLKAPYMAGEHREAMAIFEAAKQALDPDGVFNPGKMGLRSRS